MTARMDKLEVELYTTNRVVRILRRWFLYNIIATMLFGTINIILKMFS